MNDRDENQKLVRNYLLNEFDKEYRQATAEEQKLLRSYLLGESNEQERERVEERLLTDDDFFKESLLVEDELIDEYVKGELSADERKKLEATILCTSRGRQQVELARELRQYAVNKRQKSPSTNNEKKESQNKEVVLIAWWRKPLQNPYFRAVASIFVILSVSLVIYRGFIYQPPVDKGLVLLKEVYKDNRTLQAWISGFDYAPVTPTLRGDKISSPNEAKVDEARLLLLQAARETPTSAKAHHNLGRYYLTEKNFDEAIKEFKTAVSQQPANAEIHSDLGAAWLEKGMVEDENGEREKSGISFAESLEYLEKALALNSSILPALFNRALVHEKMKLYRQAQQDWQEYIKKDPNSKWSEEARKKLRDIEEQDKSTSKNEEEIFQDFLDAYQVWDNEKAWGIVIQNTDMKGGIIENRLLDEFLDASLQAQTEVASQRLRALAYVGNLAKQKIGDLYISDVVHFYESTSLAQKTKLVQARKLIKSGQSLLYESKGQDAIKEYQRAKDIFQDTNNHYEEISVTYQIGHSYAAQLETEKINAAFQLFEDLVRHCEQKHYTWLHAQSLYGTALAQFNLLNYSEALMLSRRFLKISEEIGNSNGILQALTQIGYEYLHLNNYKKSLGFYLETLNLLNVRPSTSVQMWRTYHLISQALLMLGFDEAAIEYQQEALRTAKELSVASKMGAPMLVWRSYVLLGRLYGNKKDYDEAVRNVESALELGRGFSDSKAQEEAIGGSFLQLGHIYRQKGDFSQALSNYNQSIQIYNDLKCEQYRYVAQKGILQCYAAQNSYPANPEEIETTLHLFEQNRAKILEESNRNIFFDSEQNIYDLAIDFEYSIKHDIKKAYEYSERCRARSLLDITRSAAGGLAEIQGDLPAKAQILQYAVLNDKLLIWVVSNGQEVQSKSYSISNELLNEKIHRYLDLISKARAIDLEEFTQLSENLYEILIQPVEHYLDKSKQLCIVPDKILNFVPFAALVNGSSKTYFIQDHQFLLSSSSNLFIVSTKAAQEKQQKEERILSVGNPSFDKALFALEDLKSASDEAKKIVNYYSAASLCLTKTEAIKSVIAREMEKSDVLHLALHAVTNEQSPMLSKLLLARESPDKGLQKDRSSVLTCGEIYHLNLKQPRLVVLSACRTAVDQYYGGEGMIGISRPFIAQKIPLVVASLWAVDSDVTAKLMIAFHKYRKQDGLPTIEALQKAQCDMLSDTAKTYLPYHWASFVTIGGYAEF